MYGPGADQVRRTGAQAMVYLVYVPDLRKPYFEKFDCVRVCLSVVYLTKKKRKGSRLGYAKLITN